MADTLARLFRHTISYDKPDAILAKQDGAYQPISSREFFRRVGALHLELRNASLKKGDRCAILSENRWEWAVTDFAMLTAGVVTVPLYPTQTAEQLHYMLKHSEAKVIAVSTQQQLEKIQQIWGRLPCLEGAVVFDPVSAGDRRVVSLHKLVGDAPLSEREVQNFEAAMSAVRHDDLASIIYTSGTTGPPKGVMLTHANFMSNIMDHGLDLRPTDVCLSFLPLSHVAERTADYSYFYSGATVAYAESIEAVPQNLREVRPSIVVGVPRFFEKMQARVLQAVAEAPLPRQKLFFWALKVGKRSMAFRLEQRAMPLALRLKHALASRLVFAKLRQKLGGRIRFFISGAAPLPRHVAEFFYAVGVEICEGYGLTETSPVVTLNYPGRIRFGTVGSVIRNVEVKIAPDGEILVRGPNIMKGYYKQEDLTAQSIVDGWFHTGDIGSFDEQWNLRITDRKKDLFKTSGGKYIAPQAIENLLKQSTYVSMAVVVGDGRQFPSALIVPDFAQLDQFASASGIPTLDRAELTRHESVHRMLEEEVRTACQDLAQYERIKKILVIDREFSIENGEITPTLKVRRKEVERRYAAEIQQLYN
jgi:long-chain acyl-CoA synthetase